MKHVAVQIYMQKYYFCRPCKMGRIKFDGGPNLAHGRYLGITVLFYLKINLSLKFKNKSISFSKIKSISFFK